MRFLLLNVTEKRQAEAARIREKYPDRIPVWMRILYLLSRKCNTFSLLYLKFVQVIVERAEKSDVPDIDKKK